MIFVPTAAEAAHIAVQYLPPPGAPGTSLNSAELQLAASEWDERQLRRLHVVLYTDLPIDRLYPATYYPKEDDKVVQQLCRQITALPDDKVKEAVLASDELSDNPFFTQFKALGLASTSAEAVVPGTQTHARTPSEDSDLSSSSAEDHDERLSEDIVQPLLHQILAKVNVVAVAGQWRMAFTSERKEMKLRLGTSGTTATVKSDGLVSLATSHHHSGSDRVSTIPLASIEAERRHAGGKIRHAGEAKRVSPRILGQEVAELLGQAQANAAEQLGAAGGGSDQEAFVISVHGTQLRLVAAHFARSFLAALATPLLPAAQLLRVQRSRAFEMKRAADRAAAVKMLFGLFVYIRSGAAEIAVCQALHAALRQA